MSRRFVQLPGREGEVLQLRPDPAKSDMTDLSPSIQPPPEHSSARVEQRAAAWFVHVAINLPVGTSLHPTVLSNADAVLRERGPVINQRLDRLSLACNLHGTTFVEAEMDAHTVVEAIAAVLGITTEFLTDFEIQPMFDVVEELAPRCPVVHLPVQRY